MTGTAPTLKGRIMTVNEFKKKYPAYYAEEWKFKESYKHAMTYTDGEVELEFSGGTYRDCFTPVETIKERESYTTDISIIEHKSRGTIIIVEID